VKTAVVQYDAGRDKEKNINKAIRLVSEAAAKKAKFIALPEVFNYRGPCLGLDALASVAESIPGPSTRPFQELARQYQVTILIGSLYERISGQAKAFNSSVLIDPKGGVAAIYRKIHLFNAVIDGTVVKESKVFAAGRRLKMAEVCGLRLGMSICYDVRFPLLYQKYHQKGCEIFSIPASFTKKTGESHWVALVRARAIENLSFVVAPNQIGKDSKGILAYGHSLIVSPWGEILAEASGYKEEVIYAFLSKKLLDAARQRLPGIKIKNKN
jgi:predicted amidohydrolase